MAKAQHRTPEHRAQRRYWEPIVAAGQAYCAEPVCLEVRDGRSRWIEPGSPWHVCHDPSGTVYLGPGHARCNTSEAATRGNRQRKQGKLGARRLVL